VELEKKINDHFQWRNYQEWEEWRHMFSEPRDKPSNTFAEK